MSEKGTSDASVTEDVYKASSTAFGSEKLPEEGSPERLLAEKKLVRKLDTRLLPTIFIIFIMNFIDRNGVTTARLKGMQQDLHINDLQYATVIAILFASYCPAQIPSNMILNKVSRPSWFIGTCTVIWGLTSALTGITTNFAGIIACRVFIGLPEAAFYPGAIFLLSRWYTKKELAFRSAFLYAGLLIANAFGTLMAAGILANMEGKRGIRAWRWLFFIEGALTIIVGLISVWLLPDYPHNTRWLSPFERRLAQVRLAEDAGEADKDNVEDSQLQGLIMAIKDPKVAIFSLMSMSQLLGLSFVFFFPTLTQSLGVSTTVALLLAAPPWVVASILTCLNAWHADKTGERFYHITGWWWFSNIGFIIALSTVSNAGRYVAMFLMAFGDAGFAMTLVWVSNAIPRPPAKRAAAIGVVNGFGNIGNVMGSYAWKSSWGPLYHQSMIISLCALVFSTILAFIMRQMLVRENRKLDADERAAMKGANRARVEEAARLEGITFEQAMERRKGFRYLY
ncbi:major facilitator superfamily domain-containing protein [Panaeolus papilionaceus]|nr:major facilitator superfamily domain-containing protein [Panaeolus papilionaceus]